MTRVPIELVIFDCDGVLVDSEAMSNRILSQMLNEMGWEIDAAETMRTFVGRQMSTCAAMIRERLGTVPDDFEADYRARCNKAFAEGLKPVEGIIAALDRITIPVCVASSGDHAKIRNSLTITGLLPRFEGRIFSASDVARGKPAPDLFLHAASVMGCEAERCVVVEDTPLGIQAGLAAEMKVLGYTGTFPRDVLEAEGAQPFASMRELPALIEAMEARLSSDARAGDRSDEGGRQLR